MRVISGTHMQSGWWMSRTSECLLWNGFGWTDELLNLVDSAYKDQYGSNFTSAIPTNIFGPHDNLYVYPSLISEYNHESSTGIPTIRDMQRHGARNLSNLSMLATVFCAVAATTLQFSYISHGNSLQNAVNGFWFSSIVLSIAAAGNSLLGLAWKQAM